MNAYLIFFILAFGISVVMTGMTRFVMLRFGIIDRAPKEASRKIHKRSIALGGGLALYFTFFITIFLLTMGYSRDSLFELPTIFGMFIGSTILMIGGIIDDKYTLRPRYQIISPVLACIAVIIAGIGPHIISNPFGGIIDLSQFQLHIGGLMNIVWLADILVFLWLFGMMFTTKFLDGLDGLVTGIVAIAAIVIYLLSLQPAWYDPGTAALSIIFVGACLGFLIWNFNPAKIFLGEGGSLMTGFILGCLALMSNSKIAVTIMVVGIPMVDVLRVIVMRLRKGKPVYMGDREHLHYRLLESGLSHRQAVLLLYAISSLFGMTALFLQAEHRLIALSFLFVLMLLIGLWLSKREAVR